MRKGEVERKQTVRKTKCQHWRQGYFRTRNKEERIAEYTREVYSRLKSEGCVEGTGKERRDTL